MAFLTRNELEKIGFKNLGQNVKLSDRASVYNPQLISIGDNSRIDDFCVLSASFREILIGKYVHIACYSSLIGREKIEIRDFSGLSSKVSVYSSNEDYSGNFLTNPTVKDKFRNVTNDPVIIQKHVIIGSGSIILPNVKIGIGVAIGALSLVNEDCYDFGIYAGIPVKRVKERKNNLLELESKLLSDTKHFNDNL